MPIISAIRKTDKANHRRVSFFFLWKKAYMSIDANLVSNPKDR